ncbi:MAG: LicD family protein [Paludibacteraceae bacterium]|nr:LicD family protein [Paludibacteraceae bacterium]
MNRDLSEIQQRLLQVFKHFAAFCLENEIQYYAAYGTLIGAVRHNGFIPWDDDIDVFMKRKDYDRFVSLRNKVKKPYKIATYLDGESPYPFAKFYTTEGTILEYAHFPFIIGPWIDVFPLTECDGYENNRLILEAFHYAMWKYRKAVAYASWKEISTDVFHGNVMSATIKTVKKVRYAPFKQKYIQQIIEAEEAIGNIKGNLLGDFNTGLTNNVFPKAWFQETLDVPFEDTTVSVPCGYHQLLSYLYGDYMQLPPEEKRKSHQPLYMDLKRSLKREEILKEIRLLSTGKLSLPFHVMIDEIRHRSKGWDNSLG